MKINKKIVAAAVVLALLAAWAATYQSVDILFWVACAFSLAASTFFPVLLLALGLAALAAVTSPRALRPQP